MEMEPRTYLVTGAGGFVGMHVAKQLLRLGHKVLSVDNLCSGYKSNVPEGVDFLEADCGDPEIVEELVKLSHGKIDAIIHLAAQSGGAGSFSNPLVDLKSNAASTLVLLELARKVGCKTFVFTSTCAVYGGHSGDNIFEETSDLDPRTFYAASKIAAEHYMKIYSANYGIRTVAFRLFNCYGPGQDINNLHQGIASIFLRQFMDAGFEEVIVKGALERFRDMVYVEDAAKILIRASWDPTFTTGIYNLGTGTTTTVGELLEAIKTAGSFDKAIRVSGTTPGDMFGMQANNSRLQEAWTAATGAPFVFVKIGEGIPIMIEYALKEQVMLAVHQK